MYFRKILIVLILMLFAGSGWGATLYIDPDCATPGDGSTMTCDGDADDAMDDPTDDGDLVAGNSYLLKDGTTWTGKWTLAGTGTVGDPIIIGTWTGGQAYIDATGETQGIVGNAKAYYQISNITILGDPSGGGIILRSSVSRLADGILITNCHVPESGSAGISVNMNAANSDFSGRATGVIIDGCTTDNTDGHGISVYGPYDGAIIKNSTATDFGKTTNTWGLYMAGDSFKYTSSEDYWTESPATIWTADLSDGARTGVTVDSLVYTSASLGSTHWLVRDAALDNDWDYDWDSTTVTMKLPAGVSPNSGCGCGTVINYAGTNINGIIEYGTATEARNNEDGVGIGFDRGTEDGTIRYSKVDGTNGPCMVTHQMSGGAVYGNILDNCAEVTEDSAMKITGNESGETINVTNNTVIAADDGMELGGETGSTINAINNIIDGGDNGIIVASAGYGTVNASFNDITSTVDLGANVTDGGNNITGDPLFISATNYHLQSVSPAIGAGNTGTITSTDFDGKMFLDCGDWTIGAYAWCMGGPVVYNANGRSWKYSVKGRTAE